MLFWSFCSLLGIAAHLAIGGFLFAMLHGENDVFEWYGLPPSHPALLAIIVFWPRMLILAWRR
jgi:hypothetical protein